MENKPKAVKSILLHLHPSSVREESISFTRTFGLGGMAALLVVIQFITGILLRFHYEPFPQRAYDSILVLHNQVLFGQFIRNIHHWSGVFLVLIVFFHLLRVFFTGAYQSQRRINWIIGLILLTLVIFTNFTGYLLPWDQLAYWAVTVSTGILQYIPFIGERLREFVIAGNEVNAETLIVFYTFHTAVLPILMLLLMMYHFWRVRKAGGVIVPPSDAPNKMLSTYPNLVYKEGVVSLVLIALIFVFAVFFNAPLLERANPAYSLNPTKAPWYFAGIQELLMHFHPFFAGFLIPLVTVTLIALLPWFKFKPEPNGIWFISEKGKKTARISAVFAIIITILLVTLSEYLINFEALLPRLNPLISTGIIPLIILLAMYWIYSVILKNKYKLTLTESVQSIFVIVMVSFVILTLINIFFRGINMQLTLPWN